MLITLAFPHQNLLLYNHTATGSSRRIVVIFSGWPPELSVTYESIHHFDCSQSFFFASSFNFLNVPPTGNCWSNRLYSIRLAPRGIFVLVWLYDTHDLCQTSDTDNTYDIWPRHSHPRPATTQHLSIMFVQNQQYSLDSIVLVYWMSLI